MATHAEQNARFRGAYGIVLSMISCAIVVGCATTDNQKPIERAVEISTSSGSVVPQSLAKIIVRYDPNIVYKGRVVSIDKHFSKIVQAQVAKSRIFGVDRDIAVHANGNDGMDRAIIQFFG